MYLNNPSLKKYFINFLFVLCFSFLNYPAFSESVKENTLPSVWKISNFFSSGTTFAIGPNQMITNFHLLTEMLENEGSLEKIVLTQSVSSFQIQIKRVIKVSALFDIALFETKETVSNYLKLTNDFLDPKEELSIVGYPEEVLNTIQKTGNIFQADSFSYFPVNTVGFDGLSGSPVLNIQSEIAGVAYGGVFNLLNFTKASDIQKFLSGKESTLCSSFPSPIKCFEKEMMNLKQMLDQGSAFAQYRLALIYMKGWGIDVNRGLAFYWIKKAAEQGFAPAQYTLANMYREGWGIDANRGLAFYWIKKAAEKGYALAQYALGIIYAEGAVLTFYWIKKAAERGYAPAQDFIAYMYIKGLGTEANFELALKWRKKAAEQGYVPAKKSLAYMYMEGFGTKVSREGVGTKVSREGVGIKVSREGVGTKVSREGVGTKVSREGVGTKVSREGVGTKVSREGVGTKVSREGVGTKVSREGVGIKVSREGVGTKVSREGVGTKVSREGVGTKVSREGVGTKVSREGVGTKVSREGVGTKDSALDKKICLKQI